MEVIAAIAEVLYHYKQRLAFCHAYQPMLECWFGAKTSGTFLGLYYSFGDNESRAVLLKLIKY